MAKLEDDEVKRLVDIAANRYQRGCWWADKDDLRQEGHAAVARAQQTFESAVGVPAEAYFWSAIVFAMKRYLWKESAPVSGGMHRPEESRVGLHRASLLDDKGEARPFASKERQADTALDFERWRAGVRARLIVIAGGDELLVRALLDEVTLEEVVRARPARSFYLFKHCLVVREHNRLQEVRRELSKLRGQAMRDEPLYALARERSTP